MHLKSLTLKGFKSFADRTVLQMEPGITAIVGPNGSGKSNISDAVLWVLGERNVRNLRGQAMEDVIFAGSSARKSTSFAEVELVLDNSDHVLPVDFEEVVIARRMYRTGESEYLINGAVSRRMDVLDILHDSGLGQGTHSIISQGSIDSVLASKPEDRRALIEEAAGVLKHKQRMERSARKMERIQNHVERISDVVTEVGRQLGPLERKAKRAHIYEELSEELSDVSLQLAVDDLRRYQVRHEENSKIEKDLSEELAKCKKSIDEVDTQSQELQKRIQQDSADTSEISRKQRLAAASFERIESTIAVARDRRRQAASRANEIDMSLEQSKIEAEKLEEALSKSRVDLAEAEKVLEQATSISEALKQQADEADAKRMDLEEKHAKLTLKIDDANKQLDRARQDRALTQESLTSGLARVKVLEEHKADLELRVSRDEADSKNAQIELNALELSLETLSSQEKAARELVATCTRARDAAREARDEASSQEQSIKAQIQALDALESKRAENEGDAKKWAQAHSAEFDISDKSISHAIKVAKGYEGLVELLLGSDVSMLGISDVKHAEKALNALSSSGDSGELTLVMLDDSHSRRVDVSASLANGRFALTDKIECDDSYRNAVESLLGDVVVCENVEDALKAHAEDTVGLRFAVNDGSLVWPSGKVSVGLSILEEDQGTLARIRHLNELKETLKHASSTTEEAAEQALTAEKALSEAQQESLKASEKLAELRGNIQSAKNLATQAAEKLESSKKDLVDANTQHEEASKLIDNARPDVERLDEEISTLEKEIESDKSDLKEIEESLLPIRQNAKEGSEALQKASLDVAKASEKKAYNELIATRHMSDLDRAKERISALEKTRHVKSVSTKRIEAIIGLLDLIARSSSKMSTKLEDAVSQAQDSTSGLHAMTEDLRKRSNEAHAAYDAANERMSDVKVERARIEMQVEAAIAQITEGLGVSLEAALQCPTLENRVEIEEARNSLNKRIAGLGVINPDAASEYAALKERYDFLSEQLHDLSYASRSLTKINRLIESRMKDDFASTFEQINKDFQEVFSMLFPGGNAKLSLEDPEDLENTGVEVHAQPAGKRIAKMSLMSGGEKSLTALALLFALYRTRPTPFYILDEVEAALDDSNLRRLSSFIDAMRDDTQMIMITHQRRTMEMADVLFGVSMQADGVTKVVSQKLEAALRHAE